ncbi:MAG: hypothetical protein E7214_04595 [Clostridium sp.]|nr:hypothetical protein [Clostridium sp.]
MEAFTFQTVEEVIDYISNDYGYVIFCSPEKIELLKDKVSDNVILCSTSGEYTSKGYETNVITGFKYELLECTAIEIKYPPIKSLGDLESAYNKVKDNENAFCLLLCDGLSGMEECIMTSLFFIDNKFKVIGGSAGDYLRFKETPIYKGNKSIHSIALFFNSKRKTQILKENIYEPLGKKLLVTDADPIKRIVKTFNNKPASTEYSRALNIPEESLEDYFMNNPLGKISERFIDIASPMKVNSDKSISFYCQVMPNTFVEVLKPMDVEDALNNTIKRAEFKPGFVLALNCVLRNLKFEKEGLWNEVDKHILSLSKNITGFICYGEQFYKRHFNQTMVLLLVE